MTRRARSAGSKKPLGPKKWKLTLTVSSIKRADGTYEQRRRSEVFHGTAAEADRRLCELQVRAEHGRLPVDGKRTLGAWLDEWLSTWCGRLAPITREKYASVMRTHLSPELRALRLEKLTPSHLQQMFQRLERSGVGARTIHLLRAVVRAALNQALQLGYVDRNVAAGKYVQLPQYRQQVRRVLSEVEVKALLASADAAPGELLLKFMLFTGVRPAEALALKFSAVDGRLARIQSALTWPKGAGYVLKEPKSANGKRDVPISEEIAALIREARKNRMMKGGPTSDFVFQTRDGTPYDMAGARRRLIDPILRKAGMEGVSPYCFRHTAASLMIKAGVPLTVVAKLLGHYDPRFTAAQYIHTDTEQLFDALGAMQGLIASA